ncbi:hypothetical protein GDO86_006717 [Hymenochirus boettgeri]|uniref:Olfactory receptor n=1 Tax=Hymenochirus boettgeri TaxID=247094 RepID=A0A8T2JBX4_9PIPI|nr:hypothetical protein GDO86_006717 [Hymenochirus boettgeri]
MVHLCERAFSTSLQEDLQYLRCLLVYLISFIGNLVILLLVCCVSQLHTSMYFFLSNLSILDILYTSSTLPKLLFTLWTGDKTVSYTGCITQLFSFLFCADAESLLLSSMAIDRYVAVCKPLHYLLIMSKTNCALLASLTWCTAAVNAFIFSWLIAGLSFCGLNNISNFFCDLKALLSISCTETRFLRRLLFVDTIFIGIVPFFITLTSYIFIIFTILKIQSSEGKQKAFSSCSSHICVVFLYYVSAFCLYLRDSQEGDMYLSLMFTHLVPMLNPLIYSLRNKEILRAMTRVIYGKINQ